MRRYLCLCSLFLACSQPVAPPQPATVSTQPPAKASGVQGPKLLPVDEAPREPSLVKFRDDLLVALRNHDTKRVLAAIDPRIRTTFGKGGGIEDFRRHWKLDQPDSPLFPELEQILTLGGTFQKGGEVQRFWAPYVYSAWPEAQDAFESYAVIAGGVPLHRANDAASESIATLDHDIVTRVGNDNEGALRHVRTADGREGWVEAAEVRSPIGYRAGLVRDGNTWKIEALVAGD